MPVVVARVAVPEATIVLVAVVVSVVVPPSKTYAVAPLAIDVNPSDQPPTLVTPCGPVGPVGQVGPVGPAGPWSPVVPVAPLAPVAPVGPFWPKVIFESCCLHGAL